MKIRYIGPEPEVLLSIPGASLVAKRMEWFDPDQAAEDVYVPASHMEIVVAGLSPDQWEIDRGRARKGKDAKDEAPVEAPKDPAPVPVTTDDGDEPSDTQE